MPTPAWAEHPPKTILLATDLSCRGDRPLDRAADLAERWNARLVVLTVLEAGAQSWLDWEATEDLPSWRRPPDRESVARAQLIRDLPPTLRDVEVMVRDGDPPTVIAETAREIGAELVVTGVARDEPLGRQHLGATVERLVRSYALDAIETANGKTLAPGVEEERRFLERIKATAAERFASVGEGEDVRLSGEAIAGGALTAARP